jgi:hypothetical protein
VFRVSAVLLFSVLVLACHDERPDSHVYSAPPPRPSPVAVTPAAPTPDVPLGTSGPGASITSVLDAATGAPVALNDARGTIDVMALAALGPGDWSASDEVRVELAVRGTRDTTLLLKLGPRPSTVVAHPFRLSLGALGAGHYSFRLRLLLDRTTLLVESAPVFLLVSGS